GSYSFEHVHDIDADPVEENGKFARDGHAGVVQRVFDETHRLGFFNGSQRDDLVLKSAIERDGAGETLRIRCADDPWGLRFGERGSMCKKETSAFAIGARESGS